MGGRFLSSSDISTPTELTRWHESLKVMYHVENVEFKIYRMRRHLNHICIGLFTNLKRLGGVGGGGQNDDDETW